MISPGRGVPSDEIPPEDPGELIAPESEEDEESIFETEKLDQDNPLGKLKFEKENGEYVIQDGPQFADQFINPKFRRSVIEGPIRYDMLDLSKPEHMNELNRLSELSEPTGAPRVLLISKKEEFDKNAGNWKLLIAYRNISYRKIIT